MTVTSPSGTLPVLLKQSKSFLKYYRLVVSTTRVTSPSGPLTCTVVTVQVIPQTLRLRNLNHKSNLNYTVKSHFHSVLMPATLAEETCTRLTDTCASSGTTRFCSSFWYKFLERVSPALLGRLNYEIHLF